MLDQIQDYIQSLQPYVPGKPIEETKRQYGIRRIAKLASNENPLGPSPKALRVVSRMSKESHRYPDGSAYQLKKGLASHLKVKPNQILVGNGSNEVIDLLIRAFCVSGDEILTSQAAFVAYRLCAQIHGVKTVETALDSDLKFDLDSMLDEIRSNDRIRMVFIPNPNNPTGTYLSKKELDAFLKAVREIRGDQILIVLDYAYWEYVFAKDLPDAIPYQKKYPKNVVVLRTFSKAYGLAGARVGYSVSSPEIALILEKVRQPFNVNSLGLEMAEAALKDQAFVRRANRTNQTQMKLWEKKMNEWGVPYWPSQGNFLLIDTQAGFGMSGKKVFEKCLRKGVIFRPVDGYGLSHALRVSIGTASENQMAFRALGDLKRRKG